MRRRQILLATAAFLLVLAFLPSAASGDSSGRWVRVGFEGRIEQSDHTALETAGLRFLQYSPRNAYLAYGSDSAIEAASDIPSVGGVHGVTASQKVAADLLTGGPRAVAITLATPGRPDIVSLVAELGEVRSTYRLRTDAGLTVVEALVDAAAIRDIAASPDVLSIGTAGMRWKTEDEGATQIMAANLSSGQPVPGYKTFLSGLGIDGSGVTISVVDDGVEATHPDLTGRVTKISAGPMTEGPPEGHGTHVAGIVAGAGFSAGPLGPIKDSRGLEYGVGVAPAASIIDQPAIQLTNRNFPPPGFEIYTQPSVRAGAVGWNASWTDGGGAGAGYVARAANLDALTRDADTATEGMQDYTFVFSAGNSGSGQRTITSPKEAKNIITVGSSRGHRTGGSIDDISSFSSRGLAVDGRIEPTIVAPGEGIQSARAWTGVLCTAPLSGYTYDLPPADGFGLYTGCSGTSMASPQVAGAVALIHDWWRDRNGGADPSPAMDKALLINSATDLKARNIPNKDEGWGRVNLKALFDPGASRVYVDQSVVLSDLDASHNLSITTADPSKPLRVTVVWSDAPGEPGANPALVNDLDLTLTAASGTTYLGNAFTQGRSVAGGSEDRLNNMENVYLDAPSGSYTLSVRAFNLPGDGVPGVGDQTDQDFALVISNAVLA
jgi:subtilisin family serine protease